MDETQKDNQNAQGAELPVVKPKHAGGRKPKGFYERGVQDILSGTAPGAARILDAHINQKKGFKSIKDTVLKACFYVIDHAIGKAKLKIEHSGGILSYGELSRGAETLEKKPRPILADVEEIAQKYQVKTAQDPEKEDQNTRTDELKGQ